MKLIHDTLLDVQEEILPLLIVVVDVIVLSDAVGKHVVVVVLELPPARADARDDTRYCAELPETEVAVVVLRVSYPPGYNLHQRERGQRRVPASIEYTP